MNDRLLQDEAQTGDGKRQARMDRFYAEHGPCCAGCDWWRHVNSLVGECHRSAPVAGEQRFTMIGITWASISVGAGHPYTPREHRCGDFKDEPPLTDEQVRDQDSLFGCLPPRGTLMDKPT